MASTAVFILIPLIILVAILRRDYDKNQTFSFKRIALLQMTLVLILVTYSAVSSIQSLARFDALASSPNEGELAPTLDSQHMLLQNTTTAYFTQDRATNIVQSNESVMHFIRTRFMQHQPNLATLGKARLNLFETFCYPTIIHQTNPNFYWLIQTDPDLPDELLVPLRKLLEPYSDRFFLLFSNYNQWNPREIDVDNVTVASGDPTLFRQIIQESQNRVIIDTSLDADDGLNVRFVERLQQRAMTIIKKYKHAARHWSVFCARRVVNWYIGGLVKINNTEKQKTTKKNGRKKPKLPQYGFLEDDAIKPLQQCLTPGLSYLLPPNVTQTPKMSHHLIFKRISKCPSERNGQGRRQQQENCSYTFSKDWPQAIRAKAPSSAGMHGVDTEFQDEHAKDIKWLWKIASEQFSVEQSEVNAAVEYFRSNMRNIVQDNLVGQCTLGHSCKPSSVETLQRIIEASR